MVVINTWATNSLIIVAKSHPKSPNVHGYDFQVTVNSTGMTNGKIKIYIYISLRPGIIRH